jgi:hypothetical protein
MEIIMIDGVRYRVADLPETSSYVKTSSVWNASKTRIRPCRNVKVLVGHLQREEVKRSIPYGVEPFPRHA